MLSFFRRKKREVVHPWDLEYPLLSFAKGDPWTVGAACEGTIVTGATGAGKSSSSGRLIAESYLSAGMGGLVLTVKPDERSNWERYCEATGRTGDLLVFGPGTGYRYNFLDAEFRRGGGRAGLTENLGGLFRTVLEIAERNTGGGGGREDEGYWKRALQQMVRNAIDLLSLAEGRVSIPDLYRLLVSSATSIAEAKSDEWRTRSYCYACLQKADRQGLTESQKADFSLTADYFLLELPGLSDKTRSVIMSTFTSMIDVLNRGVLRDLFCTDTTFTPEQALDGKIIVLDMPVKVFAEVGQFAQVLMKHVFQRAVERRDLRTNCRPVFLWADEAQHFLVADDFMFQTTARSSRVCTVYLTQSYSNLLAVLGGDRGRAQADSLLGNLQTKILHANGDSVTNQWASEMIGRTRQFFINTGSSEERQDDWVAEMIGFIPKTTVNSGMSEQMEFALPPSVFTTLAKGGPSQNWKTEAIVFQGGRIWQSTGENYVRTTFTQQP